MRISDWSSDVCSSDLEAVPGYGGTSLPQGAYFDNPERMEAEATASKSSNEQYRITTDADRTRPTFSNAELLETPARATAVEKDPAAFLAGEKMRSASVSCTPFDRKSVVEGKGVSVRLVIGGG